MRRALTVALVALGCSCSSAQEPSPCSPADYAVLSATCGNDQDLCDAKISERELLCAEKIRSGK